MASLSTRPSGHLVVGIEGKTLFVHRLVLLTFVGPCPEGLISLHKNHTPSDNRLVNLKYGTRSENVKMDFVAGSRSHKGARAPNAKLTDDDVRAIRVSVLPTAQLASLYGITQRNVRSVISHETWTEVQNVADSSLVGKPPTGETQMAKAPKTITPADKKLQAANLKTLLKAQADAIKAINVEQKAANAALSAAKKSADAEVKEAEKAAAAKRKAADAAIAAAQKAFAAAVAKADKATAAAAKGTEKLTAQMAALEAMPVAAAPKVKAKAAETEAA